MSGLNWFDFADKHDIRAHTFYSDLITAKAEGRNGWADTWLKVPKKLWNNLYRGAYSGDEEKFYNGFEQVRVFTYEDFKGRIYARLPQYGEVAE